MSLDPRSNGPRSQGHLGEELERSAFDDDALLDAPEECDAALEELLRADASRELSRRRERGSLRARVLARLDDPSVGSSAAFEGEDPRSSVVAARARRWLVPSLAAAATVLALGLAWLAAHDGPRPNDATVVVTPVPHGAPDAATRGPRADASGPERGGAERDANRRAVPERTTDDAPRTAQDSRSQDAPRASGEGTLARLSLPSLLGRGAQPARALEVELSSWGRDTRAAARFLLSRVRFTPQERSSGS